MTTVKKTFIFSQFTSHNFSFLNIQLRWLELPRSDENTIKFRHQHLNVLKVCGYSGRSSDVDLVNYFLENCVTLQRIIIFPQYPRSNPYAPIPPAKVVAEKKARIHAQQHLQALVPNHIKFFIQWNGSFSGFCHYWNLLSVSTCGFLYSLLFLVCWVESDLYTNFCFFDIYCIFFLTFAISSWIYTDWGPDYKWTAQINN